MFSFQSCPSANQGITIPSGSHNPASSPFLSSSEASPPALRRVPIPSSLVGERNIPQPGGTNALIGEPSASHVREGPPAAPGPEKALCQVQHRPCSLLPLLARWLITFRNTTFGGTLVFALRLDAKDVACLKKIQPLIFAEKIEHIPPGSPAAAGANRAGVAPRGPEGEAVDAPTPGAVPVIFSLPGSPGVGRLACKGEVLFVKRANINHTCIDHRDPSHVIQNVGIYCQAITQIEWEEAPAIGWFRASGATGAVEAFANTSLLFLPHKRSLCRGGQRRCSLRCGSVARGEPKLNWDEPRERSAHGMCSKCSSVASVARTPMIKRINLLYFLACNNIAVTKCFPYACFLYHP